MRWLSVLVLLGVLVVAVLLAGRNVDRDQTAMGTEPKAKPVPLVASAPPEEEDPPKPTPPRTEYKGFTLTDPKDYRGSQNQAATILRHLRRYPTVRYFSFEWTPDDTDPRRLVYDAVENVVTRYGDEDGITKSFYGVYEWKLESVATGNDSSY